MKYSETAARYAKALYELASEQKAEEKILNELRETAKAFAESPSEFETLSSPLLSPSVRKSIVANILEAGNYSELFKSFMSLLVAKGRVGLFLEVAEAYQAQSDKLHGVARGIVRSPSALQPQERTRLEEIVSKVTKQKAILEYKEAPELIGGLVAQVGSFTFDDSLDTQLRLMYENLK